jgi:hypothetical protein
MAGVDSVSKRNEFLVYFLDKGGRRLVFFVPNKLEIHAPPLRFETTVSEVSGLQGLMCIDMEIAREFQENEQILDLPDDHNYSKLSFL